MNQRKLTLGVILTQSALFTIGFYLFAFLCRSATRSMSAEIVEDNAIWRYIVEIFSAVLLFISYRLLLGAFISTKPMRKHILTRYPEGRGFRQTLFSILRDGHYWLWSIPTLVLTVLLPTAAGLDSLYQALFFFVSPAPTVERLALFSISLPCFFLLSLWAYGKLIQRMRANEALAQAHPRLIGDQLKKERIFVSLSLFALAIVGPFLLMILVSIWNVSVALLPIIAALILLFFVFRTLRAIRIRQKLIRKLHTLEENRRIRLGTIKHPILSLFSPRFSEPFTLTVDGTVYTCRLLASPNRHKHIYLDENGTGYFVRIYYLPFYGPLRRGRRGVSLAKTDSEGAAELFRTQKAFHYGFEAERKLLLISPIPQEVASMQGVSIPMGEKVGNYKVYNATTFLSHLDLGILDR